jgi:hypothetical protein
MGDTIDKQKELEEYALEDLLKGTIFREQSNKHRYCTCRPFGLSDGVKWSIDTVRRQEGMISDQVVRYLRTVYAYDLEKAMEICIKYHKRIISEMEKRNIRIKYEDSTTGVRRMRMF